MTASHGITPAAARRNAAPPCLERGSRRCWRASVALLFAGYATFSRLDYVPPLLPEFSRTFGVSHAQSRLAWSFSTAVVGMAHRAEAMHRDGLGLAIGLYFYSGTSAATRSADDRTRDRGTPQPTVAAVARARLVAVPLMLIRVQAPFDTMHPLTSALAKSRPQFDTRPQACAHPSVLPPPVAPPRVSAAPPPPAARVG